MRYHFTSIRMTISKTYNNKSCRRCGEKKTLPPLVGIQMGTSTRENIMEVLKKLNIEVPSNPAIPNLGADPEETKI